MPELHKLTPTLGVLQDRGYKVALVTDGRMSGASGKVPAAIHVTPEAADGGAIASSATATSSASTRRAGGSRCSSTMPTSRRAQAATADLSGNEHGLGRELFRMFRANAQPAELGAGVL